MDSDSEAIKDLAVDALDAIKGQDIVALDVRGQTDIADYMVVASGGTSRQVKAMVDNLLLKAREAGIEILGVEGQENPEWVLVNLIDVIVHVMLPKVREFYELERLWSVGPTKSGAKSGESQRLAKD